MLQGLGWTLTAGAVAAIAAAMFSYLSRLEQKRYVHFWAMGWSGFSACIIAATFVPLPARLLLIAYGRLAGSAGLLGGNSDFLSNRASKVVRRIIAADALLLLVPLFVPAATGSL